ncbi:hypothetical protein [Coleofasciculus chthonoplastes]|uniref:hypothetical protein n=1 Tax=Coleofasciculus chthonoplastes TaxID=64178 RepID=UPI0032F95B22
MTTTSTTEQLQVRAEPIVTLRGVSWQTYQALMHDVGDNRAWRIAYDQGILEIRMPLPKHEEPKRLLESFIEVVVDELKYFSWWFVSRKFDDSWAINQLVKVLEKSVIIEDDLDLLKHFLDLAESMPLAIIKCLSLMTMAQTNSGQYWLASYHHEEYRAILSAVLKSKDEQTRQTAKELINRLLVRGLDFRYLLPEGEALNPLYSCG